MARSLTEALEGEVTDVARRLLGWRLSTAVDGQTTEVRIVETEAYAGDIDPASHAFNGRTARNAAMFGPPGNLYVYRSYGVHWCMNVVVGEIGIAHAVLLRGGEPSRGREIMEVRRDRTDHLSDGPGKLTRALAVTGEHDGSSLESGPVRLVPDRLPGKYSVAATPRIGISKAVERPWRFVATRP